MQPTTRKLAARVHQALLALPDEVLFETLDHWLKTIANPYEDTEILAGYHEALGYRLISVASGQAYDSIEALDLVEPEAEDITWQPPAVQDLREVLRKMPPKHVYHRIVALAGDVFQQKPYATRWGGPPADQSDGYAFMQSLEHYLTLRKEVGSEGIEQFEAQYAEQLAACADTEPSERAEVFEGLPGQLTNERAIHFRVTMSSTGEQQQESLRQALEQRDCLLTPPVEANLIEGRVFYRPGRRSDMIALRRVRHLLTHWQQRGWSTWTEQKEKPKRLPHAKRKQKARR